MSFSSALREIFRRGYLSSYGVSTRFYVVDMSMTWCRVRGRSSAVELDATYGVGKLVPHHRHSWRSRVAASNSIPAESRHGVPLARRAAPTSVPRLRTRLRRTVGTGYAVNTVSKVGLRTRLLRSRTTAYRWHAVRPRPRSLRDRTVGTVFFEDMGARLARWITWRRVWRNLRETEPVHRNRVRRVSYRVTLCSGCPVPINII